MPSNVAKCKCEECQFNVDFECHADSIEVMSVGDKRVQSSEGTCCNTFKPKV